MPSARIHPLGMALFPHSVRHSPDYFDSGGQRIRVDRFLPKSEGKLPVILALHGSGGARTNAFEEPASLLASSGFAVFVVHYFDRTGTNWADDATVRQHFPVWMETIRDAITYTESQDSADANRIALVGFSLGAYLALAVALKDKRVRAVVDYFGGIPEELAQHAADLPPVLILHGEQDRTVPVSEAHRLEKLLREAGRPYEIKLFPGSGHGFGGLTLIDAAQRTLSFLRNQLAKASQPKTA